MNTKIIFDNLKRDHAFDNYLFSNENVFIKKKKYSNKNNYI